ncbi:MAG: ABC transporter ATP-binding protein [Oscillospiraceae bacterium]
MLKCDNVSKSFSTQDKNTVVLENLNLNVEKGELFVILGQSGCGKSTLLRLMGGFIKPDSGKIYLDGKEVEKPSKDVIMMFQSFDQLFSWFTLQENIIYALKKTGVEKDRAKAAKTAKEYLDKTGLSGFENAYPHQLSGGMKQRGALARALAISPKVLLMDEPFSSIDYLSRLSMQRQVKTLQKQTGSTVVLVTHDIEEAVELGDRIAILSKNNKVTQLIENSTDKDNLIKKLKELLVV